MTIRTRPDLVVLAVALSRLKLGIGVDLSQWFSDISVV